MMKTLFLFMVLILVPVTVMAGPFVVSDPYPSSGQQPDGFRGTVNGVGFDVPYATDANGLRYFNLDLAGMWLTGTNSLIVRAYNIWGESETVPFDFNAGGAVPPLNVHVIK